ncbi:hypothetical protein L596_030859 [Steinernema carpocapsae]|uniref:Uncharacterized protein n=1 Tax=Steinernema carpocapsae TaxID=34508 RepID=A0A4U5LND0_STECR|nr:hypothetical protein L596_030859 [Steinernema carpocapsae]
MASRGFEPESKKLEPGSITTRPDRRCFLLFSITFLLFCTASMGIHVDQRLKLYQYANFQPDLNVSPLTPLNKA